MSAPCQVFAENPQASPELLLENEELRRQLELLQTTLEHIGEGLSVFDRQGHLIVWNSRFIELLDLPPDLKLGTPLRSILMRQALRGDFGDVDPAETVNTRFELFYRDLPMELERRTLTARILRIRRRAMPDGCVVSVYSDITARKESEHEMERARAQAEYANRAKSEFLANMSHELRTPLNAIIGFSEVIRDEILGPLRDRTYHEYVRDIHSSGQHLLSIINDVLDMSKIEAGKLELASDRVIAQLVVADTARMVSEEARERNLQVTIKAPVEDIVLSADERAIKQIVLNLMSNAVKFSKENGAVEVRVALDQAGGLLLEFEDNGIGMTEDDLDRVMQPFAQANGGIARSHGGTGLGLPITKGLVEAHGGTLSISSSPGIGTLVSVRMPIVSPQSDVDQNPVDQKVVGGSRG
jgi:signal transduction histidine kinase